MATTATTMDTTSAGMPPIATTPALDSGFAGAAQKLRGEAGHKVRSLADDGKAQVTQTLDGIADAAREIAAKLDGNGAGIVAKYLHQAADTVAGWSATVAGKSVEEMLDDTRSLVRTRPAVAVGVSLAAGFVVSRFLRAGAPAGGARR